MGYQRIATSNEPTPLEHGADIALSSAGKLCETPSSINEVQLRADISAYVTYESQVQGPGYSPAAMLHEMTFRHGCPQVEAVVDQLQAAHEDLRPVEARIVLP